MDQGQQELEAIAGKTMAMFGRRGIAPAINAVKSYLLNLFTSTTVESLGAWVFAKDAESRQANTAGKKKV